MDTFIVRVKASGQTVYRYEASQPVEWAGMEFSTHDHVLEGALLSVEPTTQELVWTPLEFMRRLTGLERYAIRAEAKTDHVVEDFLALLTAADEVKSTDPDVQQGLDYFAYLGLIAPERIAVILGST